MLRPEDTVKETCLKKGHDRHCASPITAVKITVLQVLNLVHDVMSTCGFKLEYSGKGVSLFIVLRERHLMKGPDAKPTFSVLCSSDILEQHTIIMCP